MKATFLDLRRKTREILDALDRRESITIMYRGKEKAVLTPLPAPGHREKAVEHPTAGMWADREDMEKVDAYVRKLRRGRVHDF